MSEFLYDKVADLNAELEVAKTDFQRGEDGFQLINIPAEEVDELRKHGRTVWEEIPGSPFKKKRVMLKAVEKYLAAFGEPRKEDLSLVSKQVEAEREEDMNGKGKYDTVFNFQLNTQNGVPELTPAVLTVEDAFVRGAAETERITQKYLRNVAIGYSEQLNGMSITYRCSWINVKAQPYNESVTIVRFDINQAEYGRVAVLANGGDDMLRIRHRAEMILTGQFVDNMDGRWHLVKLNGAYRLATKKLANQYKGVQFDDAEDHSFVFKYGFVREDLIGGLEIRPDLKNRGVLLPYMVYDPKIPFLDKKEIYLNPIPIEFPAEPAYVVGGAFEKFIHPLYRDKVKLADPRYIQYDYEYRYNAENGMSFVYILSARWKNFAQRNEIVPNYPLSIPRVQPYYNHGETDYIEKYLAEKKPEEPAKPNTTVLTTLAAAGLLAWWKFR